jgi:hypothetical protein
MIPLLLLAAASADLDALDQAVSQCDRNAANPAFAGEAARRSQFLIDAYKEQESITNARLDIVTQRQALTDDTSKTVPAQLKDLDKQDSLLDARSKALNDQRSLEAAREQAMDAMRHYFLLHCPAGAGSTSERAK